MYFSLDTRFDLVIIEALFGNWHMEKSNPNTMLYCYYANHKFQFLAVLCFHFEFCVFFCWIVDCFVHGTYFTLAQTLWNVFSISTRSTGHGSYIPSYQRIQKKSSSYRFFCPIHAGFPGHRVVTQLDFVGMDPIPTATKTKKYIFTLQCSERTLCFVCFQQQF